MLLLLGIVLFGAGVGCLVLRIRSGQKYKAMVTTETLSTADLTALRDAATQAAGPGAFSYRCEVVGAAAPDRSGPLRAQLSQTDCVWHQHVVTRKYWEWERNAKGHRRKVTKSEKVAELTSDHPFVVRDATGSVLVDPRGVTVDRAEQVVDRYEPHHGTADRKSLSFAGFTLDLGSSGNTIGHNYEEWVLRPGTHLYVLGEAVDRNGALVVGKPDEGPYLVSTRGEQELVAAERTKKTWFSTCAALGGLLGAASLVASAFV